jgi:hypothetical protein
MFYIIGGAPRSGKSLTSKRLLVEKQSAYFSMDALVSMFQADPSLGIQFDLPFVEKAERLWKFGGYLADYLYQLEKNYVIEGDSLIPSRIYQFIQNRDSSKIKVCFVGFTELSVDEKLKIIREHDSADDWTAEHSDEELVVTIQEMIEYSNYLKNECEKYGFKFFDVSKDFAKIQQEIFDFLTR